MGECPNCGRAHRSEEAFARCATKEERKAERARKKAEDKARRVANAKDTPPVEYIHQLRREGKNFEQILGALRKNYLPPEFESDWDLYTVVFMYAEGLHWGSLDTETIALLLLEKHFLGEFITAHPMEFVHFPGTTPIMAVTGDDYRLEFNNDSDS